MLLTQIIMGLSLSLWIIAVVVELTVKGEGYE
jgi:hypothetical protein